MDRRGRVAGRVVTHARARTGFVAVVALVAALAIPAATAGATPKAAKANGPIVKVGMIVPLTGPLAATPEEKDAFNAAIKAFNARGGAGTNHARLQADVCDSRGDANQEVACARQMVSDGVAATLNDLTYVNPSGVVAVLEPAGIPRIGIGGTDLSEFTSTVSFPTSPGVIAAYLGTAVGFKQANHTKICLVRTDAPTGATFRGFLTPSFTAIGVQITCDIAVPTGATDYAPYIAQLQRENPDAVLISHSDSVTTQLIAAMGQLNAKLNLGGAPGSFALGTLTKYSSITKGTVLSDGYPFPSQQNVKAFPGLKQYFADMKAAKKSSLNAAKLKSQDFTAWVAVMAFVNATKSVSSFSASSVLAALKADQNISLLGLTPPWTPSTPGFSVFKSSSNHFVYISHFNGKAIVTDKTPVDVTQFIK